MAQAVGLRYNLALMRLIIFALKIFVRPLWGFVLILGLSHCVRPDPTAQITIAAPAVVPAHLVGQPTPLVTPRANDIMPTFTPLGFIDVIPDANLPTYEGTPTPDPTRPLPPTSGNATLTHYVGTGETLGYIAQLYGSSVEALLEMNGLAESDFLYVGQALLVPTQAALIGPSFKIIPDSEVVYGPAAQGFSVRDFATPYGGYLLSYGEEVEGIYREGPEIVQLVADRFSVNPRLLVAMLEYRSNWVTRSRGAGALDNGFPLDHVQAQSDGLYAQLSWAANELNWAYYGRSEGGIRSFLVSDGNRVAFASDINDGTAAVQNWLASHDRATYNGWLQESGPDGFYASYMRLFGNPFAYTVDPLWPANMAQPSLSLPWARNETWYLTGGPHGGWATGSAWAALDFVPAGDELGCVQSDAWVTAMSPGIVARSGDGAVVVDLDGDGFAGTGWAITYMHLESRDRIEAGLMVQTGDRLGHPSCEGGYSNGTHVHIARSYNGRWVSADGRYPFTMSGWVTQAGDGYEYNGYLVRGNITKEACECRTEENAITVE